MKNFVFSGLLFMMTLLFPFQLIAASASVGANLWYAWTVPGFKDEFMGKNESTSYNNNFEMVESGAVVYGGLFSLQLADRISLGGVFSYGAGWKLKADYIYNPSGTEIHMYKNMDDVRRFEGDLTLNYTLTNIFKIFFGWKYFGERATGDYYYYPTSNPAMIFLGEFELGLDSTGPGLGLSSILNLHENTFLITTASAIYQKSRDTKKVIGITSISDSKESDGTSQYLGGNFASNIAYVIPDTSVTLSFGGRYQYLRNTDSGRIIRFYGVVLSAIYAFEI